MKRTTWIYIIVGSILLFLFAYVLFLYFTTPDVNEADNPAPDIINQIDNGGTNAPIQTTINPAPAPLQRPTITITPATPVSTYSPFDKNMYLNNTGSANLLDQATVTAFVTKLKGKLNMYTKYLAFFWNVDNTIKDLTSSFQYQIQVSQIANTYYTTYNTDMLSDMNTTLSDSNNGRYFLTQITSIANGLPLGY